MQKMFTVWSVILYSAELGGTGNIGGIPPKRCLDKTVFPSLWAYLLHQRARRRLLQTEPYANELPAMIAESTRPAIDRRIILTSFRDSLTPVMRMLMTMLLMLTTLTTATLRFSC